MSDDRKPAGMFVPVYFWGLVLLAALAFAWIFAVPSGNFWIKLVISVCVLCAAAFTHTPFPWRKADATLREALIGIAATAVLYGIFWLGDFCAAQLFDFAPRQVESIYAIRELGNLWVIGAVLLLTSTGEELFWRGYILRGATARWGNGWGPVIGAGLYGAVHIPSGNFMLVMAALTAGIFWCALYRWRNGNLTACIISHTLWTITVFLLFPIR